MLYVDVVVPEVEEEDGTDLFDAASEGRIATVERLLRENAGSASSGGRGGGSDGDGGGGDAGSDEESVALDVNQRAVCDASGPTARCAFSDTEIHTRGCHWIPSMFA
jgi:hypothetical protein